MYTILRKTFDETTFLKLIIIDTVFVNWLHSIICAWECSTMEFLQRKLSRMAIIYQTSKFVKVFSLESFRLCGNGSDTLLSLVYTYLVINLVRYRCFVNWILCQHSMKVVYIIWCTHLLYVVLYSLCWYTFGICIDWSCWTHWSGQVQPLPGSVSYGGCQWGIGPHWWNRHSNHCPT